MSQIQGVESNEKKLRANERMWGIALVAAGWTLVPSTILERQKDIGLDPVDMNILMQLARYWWRADNPPHPTINTIATCIQRSVSTVQRRVKRLERAGFIEIEHRYDPRHGARMSSNYRFTGLIEAATAYAEDALREKEANQQRKASRLKRRVAGKSPDLKVIADSGAT